MFKEGPSLVRQRFGEWHVIWAARLELGRRTYVCRCSCGEVRMVRADVLISGRSTCCNISRHQKPKGRPINPNSARQRVLRGESCASDPYLLPEFSESE